MDNPLLSYIRHLIVTGVLIVVEKLKLPVEGAESAANIIALSLIGTLSWLVVKYGKIITDKLKNKLSLMLFLGALAMFSLPSCDALKLPESVKGSLFFKNKDSGAKGGLRVENGKLTPWARVPLVDENGNVTGGFEVDSAK
eukprot:Seg14393.2 transcript_id=Seg14393.2/GoldUCD/mRNA.D3Y31 product="hypothetical protein" pseudo=true protein_id=Seg14393.2/GoldUCD/D3Y31